MSNTSPTQDALFNEARALHDAGRLAEAQPLLERLLDLNPNHIGALQRLGICIAALGQPHRAVAIFQKLCTLVPDHPELLHSLGLALHSANRNTEAEIPLRQSIALRPTHVAAHNTLGLVLHDLGKLHDAIYSHREALRLQPDHPHAWNNLAIALGELGRTDEAIAAFHHALRTMPNFPAIHVNLARQLAHQGKLDDAMQHHQRALELDPNYIPAHLGIAEIHKETGDIERHLEICNRYASNDDSLLTHSRLLSLHYHPDIDMPTIAREHGAWASRIESANSPLPHHNDRSPDRPLRIGYLSPDFRDHIVAHTILPLFTHRSRQQFHTTCYMLSPLEDTITSRFRAAADTFRSVVAKSPAEIAALIQQDQIDILVDLALHTAGNALAVCALKPAPIQISFAGYPASTGLSRIDYRLTDPLLDPPGLFDQFSSEIPLRLDGSFLCYEAIASSESVTSLPALANHHITFGCLNHPCKMNHRVLDLWARILQSVPHSHLLLKFPEGSARESLLHRFTANDITADRIHPTARLPYNEYLRLYHRIDIMLDTFPYNGHTTSLDALWHGVPLVTLIGQTPVGRAGLSQLTHLNLPDLAANTPEEFITTAATLAADLDRLQSLRATLRPRMQNSILMDGPRYTRNIESLYRQAWQTHCR